MNGVCTMSKSLIFSLIFSFIIGISGCSEQVLTTSSAPSPAVQVTESPSMKTTPSPAPVITPTPAPTQEPTVTMYAPDGRTRETLKSEVEAYQGVGWYLEPVTLMYAADGRTRYTLNSEIDTYKNVGWYLEPVTLMYAADGRTTYVLNSEVEAYKQVNWYTSPVKEMYAPDGRTIMVAEDEMSSYQNVGWYKTRSEAQAANKTSSGSQNRPNSGGRSVYRTPKGKRYHFDPDCGGKNSYSISMEDAKNSGLTPCAKCAY